MTNSATPHLHATHQAIVERLVAAGQRDARVVAAFLGGSYATGKADSHSDLDLYLITTAAAYAGFLADKEAWIRQLGEPLFREDWGTPHGLFFILADGTEGELWIGHVNHFTHIHGGAYIVLLDKEGILAGVNFPEHTADLDEQHATLRQLIMDFWHEWGHFHKALAREQLWFAYGAVETIRHICVNLARLQHNFADPDIGAEPFFKLEQVLPVEQLACLRTTCCALEPAAIQQAGQTLLQFYREVAISLATSHSLPYPTALDHVMTRQPVQESAATNAEPARHNIAIRLAPITIDNWGECSQLQVKPAQAHFITSNLISIAEVQFYPEWRAYAIYADDQMVGFTMIECNEEEAWWISSLMIGAAYQGQGYGRLALAALVELVAAQGCTELLVGYANDNAIARKLYQRAGFVELGLDDEGDMVAQIKLAEGS